MNTKKERVVAYLETQFIELMRQRQKIMDKNEFADYLGIPFATLSYLLSTDNERLPSGDTADKICIALQSNELNEILGRDPHPLADPELARIIHSYERLDERNKERWLRQMETFHTTPAAAQMS